MPNKFIMIGAGVILLSSGTVYAACTTMPSCSDLGYASSSCSSGVSLKCPFDKSKLICLGNMTCSSLGYTQTSCSGNSIKCPFDTTKLVCLDSVTSGGSSNSGTDTGSGNGGNSGSDTGTDTATAELCKNSGYIYYSDGTCSKSKVSSKTAQGVIIYYFTENSQKKARIVDLKDANEGGSDYSLQGEKAYGVLYTHDEAVHYCNNTKLGGQYKKVPDSSDLLRINTGTTISAITAAGGKGFYGDFRYWTSDMGELAPGVPDGSEYHAMYLGTSDEKDETVHKDERLYVRCVTDIYLP